MSLRESDPEEYAAKMRDRLSKIRENPARALFSEFKGVSRGGAVTVRVDMMGRLTSVSIAPGAAYEGAEAELTQEIMHAHSAAQDAANVVDFSRADLARALENAPQLQAAIDEKAEATPPRQPARPPENVDDDDDNPQSWLR